jgi:hypothetical protein
MRKRGGVAKIHRLRLLNLAISLVMKFRSSAIFFCAA